MYSTIRATRTHGDFSLRCQIWERTTNVFTQSRAAPPNLLHKVTGDAFAPRNKYALNIDSRLEPPMFKISETHSAATWLLHPKAPKVDMPPELRDRIERMKKEGGIA